MRDYIEINKIDLMLGFTFVAAIYAYLAWEQASSANRTVSRPIYELNPDGDDVEDGDADQEKPDENDGTSR